MTVSNGQFIRVNARMKVDGQDCICSYLFKADFLADMSDATFLTELNSVFNDLYTPISARIDADVDAYDLTAHEVHWDSTEQKEVIDRVIGTETWTATWTAVGAALPAGVAALVSFRTGALKTRLRKYISGIEEGQWEEGKWGDDLIDDLTDFASILLAGLEIVAGNWLRYGTFSKYTNAFAQVLSAVIAFDAAYQRRRRPGTGS